MATEGSRHYQNRDASILVASEHRKRIQRRTLRGMVDINSPKSKGNAKTQQQSVTLIGYSPVDSICYLHSVYTFETSAYELPMTWS